MQTRDARILLRGVALVFCAVLLTGCATSLTNMSQARVLKPGEVQASFGYQIDVHTQAVEGVLEAGEVAAEQIKNGSGEISEETLRRGLDAALLLTFFPISGSPEVIGRVGVWDGVLEGLDLGIRYNGTVLKGDLRLGLFESADRALAVTAQVGYGSHSSVAPGAIEWVTLTEWSRKDFDFAVSVGWEYPDIFKAYVAPRVLLSSISSEPKLSDSVRERLPENLKNLDPHAYFPSSTILYLGGNTGFLVGYKYVFFNVDLSVFRIQFEPEILGQTRDYGGWAIAPTIGLTGFLN